MKSPEVTSIRIVREHLILAASRADILCSMQFQVPQFIEIEDKIFGPFTFKQFIYIAGAAGLAFVAYRLLPLYIAAFVIAGVGAFGAALALFEWNGRPFILSLEYGFYYLLHPKLYLWSHERKEAKAKQQAKKQGNIKEIYVPQLSQSKLTDLAWSLDIKEKIEQIGMRNFEAARSITPPNTSSVIRTAKEGLVK